MEPNGTLNDADEVRRRLLEGLRVPFDEEELRLHCYLAKGGTSELGAVERWLHKLSVASRRLPEREAGSADGRRDVVAARVPGHFRVPGAEVRQVAARRPRPHQPFPAPLWARARGAASPLRPMHVAMTLMSGNPEMAGGVPAAVMSRARWLRRQGWRSPSSAGAPEDSKRRRCGRGSPWSPFAHATIAWESCSTVGGSTPPARRPARALERRHRERPIDVIDVHDAHTAYAAAPSDGGTACRPL